MSDLFALKAGNYEKGSRRVANVLNIIDAIQTNINLNKSMHIMDFGAGTGLLLSGIAPQVGKITAVDISPSMIAELEKKQADLPCELDILQVDLTKKEKEFDKKYYGVFDGIISSMTLHHIEDIPAIFTKLRTLLKKDGFIALADLDTENGSFHTEDTGVYHHGFDRDYLRQVASEAGFNAINISTANEFEKQGEHYSVFLLVGNY